LGGARKKIRKGKAGREAGGCQLKKLSAVHEKRCLAVRLEEERNPRGGEKLGPRGARYKKGKKKKSSLVGKGGSSTLNSQKEVVFPSKGD